MPTDPALSVPASLDVEAIKAREVAATKGPWRWVLSLKSKEVHLEAAISGLEIVMDFVRWGMGGAQPRFNSHGVMHGADKFADVEKGREHHASWYQRIAHPDAAFIAHARQDIPALLAEVERLQKLLKENGND